MQGDRQSTAILTRLGGLGMGVPLAWVAAVILIAAPLPASAGKRQAQRHAEKSQALLQEGDFRGALDELSKAYAEHPNPEYLFAQGGVHASALDECEEAIVFFKEFLDSVYDGEPLREMASEELKKCEDKIEAKRLEGLKNKEPILPVVEPDPEAEPAPATRLTVVEKRPWTQDYYGHTFVAVGVIGVGIGGMYLSKAQDDFNAAEQPGNTYEEFKTLRDAGIEKRNTGIAIMSVGGAALTTGILFYVLRDRSVTREVAADERSAGGFGILSPQEGLGLTYSGSF